MDIAADMSPKYLRGPGYPAGRTGGSLNSYKAND
jgi:hypothetical protein